MKKRRLRGGEVGDEFVQVLRATLTARPATSIRSFSTAAYSPAAIARATSNGAAGSRASVPRETPRSWRCNGPRIRGGGRRRNPLAEASLEDIDRGGHVGGGIGGTVLHLT